MVLTPHPGLVDPGIVAADVADRGNTGFDLLIIDGADVHSVRTAVTFVETCCRAAVIGGDERRRSGAGTRRSRTP
jgi:hypothetical protein